MPAASKSKGYNSIDTALRDWNESDRQDAIDFAMHPGNGATTIALYLSQRGVKVSIDTVYRWQKSLINESARINRIKQAIGDYQGLDTPGLLAFLAGSTAELLISLQQRIEASEDNLTHKEIQSYVSLVKESRSAALAINTPQSTASMKELELGFMMNFADKLEAIFADDEIVLDRIKLACKGILAEVEGQYQY